MPKRKREDVDDNTLSGIQDRAVRIKASRLKAKIDQSNKTLKDAVQLARGFERQKLSRRQKQAEQQPHTLLRLREEVIVVKEIDPTKTAKDYLFKQLVKTKKIRESPPFVALFGDDPKYESSKSAAEGNVIGRLFKSNPVKEVLPEILRSIRDILGVDNGKSESEHIDAHKSVGHAIQDDPVTSELEFEGFSDHDQHTAINPHNTLLEGISLDDVSGTDSDGEGSEQILEDYDDRLAASSDESEAETVRPYRAYADKGSSVAQSGSDSEMQDEGRNRMIRKAKVPSPRLTETSFLPSLSMGGYYSGSDDSMDDGYRPENNVAEAQQRKNRRGQRARREIAAKKFGQNAKHLIKQREDESKGHRSRNTGWDPKRGAVDGSKSSNFSRGTRAGSGAGATGANGDAINLERARGRQIPNKTNKADIPLHPSWEAARKKKIDANTAAFSGKKITFD